MKRNPSATCGNCPYFFTLPDIVSGECRVIQPVPVERDRGTPDSAWPEVGVEFWCGRHPAFALPEPAEPVKLPPGFAWPKEQTNG